MNTTELRSRDWARGQLWPLAIAICSLAGCEVDSFINPSVLGRWERTPLVLPILDQLDVIEEPKFSALGSTAIMPEDLLAQPVEYVVGPGDIATISVFELMSPGQEWSQPVRVDPLGKVNLRMIGRLHMAGLTVTQLEEEVARIVIEKGLLKDPMVTVIVNEPRQDTYTVIGEPRQSGTAVGTFSIPRADFRILEAMANARGVSGRIKNIHVIRQIEFNVPGMETEPSIPAENARSQEDRKLLQDPTELIDQLLDDSTDATGTDAEEPAPAPLPLDQMVDQGQQSGQWVHVGDKWVQVNAGPTAATSAPAPMEVEVPGHDQPIVTQRIIEVPYQKLLEGQMQYNIVVRPGDVISVPSPLIGNVYIMGAINRPGTFGLPGDKDLTVKLLVAAAGGLSQIAWPERVDLVRRIADNQEAMVRLDLRKIFEGRQPDFFLKPNDMLNVGQSLWATPIAVIRNGFRMTYGFGFILDRNFGQDVFRELNETAR